METLLKRTWIIRHNTQFFAESSHMEPGYNIQDEHEYSSSGQLFFIEIHFNGFFPLFNAMESLRSWHL